MELWESMVKLEELRSEHGIMTLCHYPVEDWRDMNRGTYHLHGHCHGSRRRVGRRLDIGVDSAIDLVGEYRPFSLDEVHEILKDVEPSRHYAGRDK